MRRAEIDGHLHPPGCEQLFVDLHEQIVRVNSAAIMPGMRTPGGFADDVALAGHDRFGEVDDRRAVNELEEKLILVENVLEMIGPPQPIPVYRLELIDMLARRSNLFTG